jgi:hypothetical protein
MSGLALNVSLTATANFRHDQSKPGMPCVPVFAAVHESGHGTTRRFAALPMFDAAKPKRTCQGVAAVGALGSLDDQNQGREPADREDQEREPTDGEDAKPQNGFCCSLTGRAGRGVVRASCFFVGLVGCSVNPLFAVSGAGSDRARIGSASDGVGGTHGEFAS